MGTADRHGREPDARRQHAVEHALAELSPTWRAAMPVADDLLHERVADRHAAGDREMRADGPRETQEAEQARTAAVDSSDASQQADGLARDEQNVDKGARADGGDHRYALGGGSDLAIGLQRRAAP